MKYALTFRFYNARYSVHAADCPACCTTTSAVRLTTAGEFSTIAAATAWAHADESEKAGEPVKALLSVCKCTKGKYS